MWTEERDVVAMQEALSGIIGAYERDFAKRPSISELPKLSMIWKSIPHSWRGRTRSLSTKWLRRVRGPENMRTLFNGWWTPCWCIRSTADPRRGYPKRHMTICPRSKSSLWTWASTGGWPSYPLQPLERAIGFSRSSRARSLKTIPDTLIRGRAALLESCEPSLRGGLPHPARE